MSEPKIPHRIMVWVLIHAIDHDDETSTRNVLGVFASLEASMEAARLGQHYPEMPKGGNYHVFPFQLNALYGAKDWDKAWPIEETYKLDDLDKLQ